MIFMCCCSNSQELTVYNNTVKEVRTKLQSVEACNTLCGSLEQRVDQLETWLRQTHQQVSEIVTNSIDQHVANLTLTTGVERIVTNVINKKTFLLSQAANKLRTKVDKLESALSLLKQPTQSLQPTIKTSDTTASHSSISVAAVTTAATTDKPSMFTSATSTSANRSTVINTPMLTGSSTSHSSTRVNISRNDLKAMFGGSLLMSTVAPPSDSNITVV